MEHPGREGEEPAPDDDLARQQEKASAENLPPEALDVIANLPPEVRDPIANLMQSQGDPVEIERAMVAITTQYSGILPPPAMLKQYNESFPGCAKRIVDMADGRIEHQKKMETKELVARVVTQYLGIGAAVIVTLAVLGIAGALLMTDREVAGFTALALGVTPVFAGLIRRIARLKNSHSE